ncbi:MAG: hypothetical protein WCG76_09265 [Verrucomicrobiota bacterium]|jgi:hypothetical protein
MREPSPPASENVTSFFAFLDLLHVSTALVLDAREFLSFDANQISLAAAEGLATPLNA